MVMNRKTATTIFLSVCVLISMHAQSLKQQGINVEDVVPEGWSHNEVTGDLNKDGIADLVVKSTPNFKENMHTNDDGTVYNYNQPILAIYLGNTDGTLTLWRQYDQVLSADDNEDCFHEVTLEITERGVLRITTSLAYTMGSWAAYTDRYYYRYQDGDFYLIGKENEELMRNTGKVTTVSENYLTWKRQLKTEDISEETVPKEKWSRLQKKPLEKLGARVMGE